MYGSLYHKQKLIDTSCSSPSKTSAGNPYRSSRSRHVLSAVGDDPVLSSNSSKQYLQEANKNRKEGLPISARLQLSSARHKHLLNKFEEFLLLPQILCYLYLIGKIYKNIMSVIS